MSTVLETEIRAAQDAVVNTVIPMLVDLSKAFPEIYPCTFNMLVIVLANNGFTRDELLQHVHGACDQLEDPGYDS